MPENSSILIIGAGSMGRALAMGFKSDGSNKSGINLYVNDVHSERATQLAEAAGAQAIDNKTEITEKLDAVVLAIKPHDLKPNQFLDKESAAQGTLAISFLAGTKMDDIAKIIKFDGPMVRAMPNICAKVRLAATAAAHNDHCNDDHLILASNILETVGNLHWLKEELMDAVTGVSGSGPAYIFMVIEAMTDGGVKMGLPREVSYSLAVQTVAGAAELLKETGQHPAILKDQVTTPGGTTINAIHDLEKHGLRSMFISAIATATRRSKDLHRPPEERRMD